MHLFQLSAVTVSAKYQLLFRLYVLQLMYCTEKPRDLIVALRLNVVTASAKYQLL